MLKLQEERKVKRVVIRARANDPVLEVKRNELRSRSIHPLRRFGEAERRSDVSTSVVHLKKIKKKRLVWGIA